MTRSNRQLTLFPDEPALPEFTVRESARARRLSIKVYPHGRVEVVVPRRTRPAEVEAFVGENATWIRDARRAYAREIPPESARLPASIRLPAIGRTVGVQYLPGDHEGVRVSPGEGTLRLLGRTADEGLCAAALRRWLKSVARAEFAPRLQALSEACELPFARLQIRAQRSCWGSRSSSGTLSLNLCLLFVEPAVLRYLMVHELCHGRHMNHSKRFWRLVGRFEPQYRRLDRELADSWRAVPPWLGLY